MHDKLAQWKARLFDLAVFVFFVRALVKLIYYEFTGTSQDV